MTLMPRSCLAPCPYDQRPDKVADDESDDHQQNGEQVFAEALAQTGQPNSDWKHVDLGTHLTGDALAEFHIAGRANPGGHVAGHSFRSGPALKGGHAMSDSDTAIFMRALP
jgi:hypothetical protein